jgi:hypothetical protein
MGQHSAWPRRVATCKADSLDVTENFPGEFRYIVAGLMRSGGCGVEVQGFQTCRQPERQNEESERPFE